VASEKEIVVGGRKVTGSAQRRGRRAFLQHGAIPLRMDYGLLAGAAGRSREEAEAFRASFAGLSDLKPEITPAALRAALREGFAEAFGSPPVEAEPSPAERAEARRLERTRYGTREWTESGKDLGARPECAAAAFGGGAAQQPPARQA
jgi:lipoate-protein ligase A